MTDREKHPAYWKLKAAYLAVQNVRLEAEAAVAKLQAQLQAAMTEAGLDPAGNYELDDATETITEKIL